jgi:hypothetical protein
MRFIQHPIGSEPCPRTYGGSEQWVQVWSGVLWGFQASHPSSPSSVMWSALPEMERDQQRFELRLCSFWPLCLKRQISGSAPSRSPSTILDVFYGRTPENPPKCIIPGPGKILRSEGYVCANPGKFGVISDEMYMSNPGISRGWMKVYVIIRGKFW